MPCKKTTFVGNNKANDIKFMMRYLYILALILFTGFYTFSNGTGLHGPVNETGRGGDDDDDNGKGGGNAASNKNNYLEVEQTGNLNFTVNDPEEFEDPQVATSAVRLRLKTQRAACAVYVRVSSYNVPQGASQSNIPLELDHRTDNSDNVTSLVRDPLRLSSTDQRLFVQPKSKNTYTYNYDLRLAPVGYQFPPGQYNFTIMFTMTQQ